MNKSGFGNAWFVEYNIDEEGYKSKRKEKNIYPLIFEINEYIFLIQRGGKLEKHNVIELALFFTLNFRIASLNFSNGKHE